MAAPAGVMSDVTLPSPVDGGGVAPRYTWTQTTCPTQQAADANGSAAAGDADASVDLHIALGLEEEHGALSASDVQCTFERKAMHLLVRGQKVVSGETQYELAASECVWQLVRAERGQSVEIHLEKLDPRKVWSAPIVGDPEVDTRKLKEEAGLVPPEEKPVRVTDPDTIARLAKEHPDLDLSAIAQSSTGQDATPGVNATATRLGVQSKTKDTYRGQARSPSTPHSFLKSHHTWYLAVHLFVVTLVVF